MAQIIAVINQKGGVAKTTTAHAVGIGLANKGNRVLFVDMDSQGSLTAILGASAEGANAMDLILRKAPTARAIRHIRPYVDLIAASAGLASDGLLTDTGKEYRLREALQPVLRAYDYVVIDCPPSLGVLTVNALTAATTCIVPAQADSLSLMALNQLQPIIETIRRYTNRRLSVAGVLITRYNGRAVLSRDAVTLIEAKAAEMGTKVYKTRIRECIAIKEAQATLQDIFSYAPRSNGAKDYSELINELEVK